MTKSVVPLEGATRYPNPLSKATARIDVRLGSPVQHDRAVEAELQRLAAELHDRVAQSLWGLDLALDQLRDLITNNPDQVNQRLAPTHQLVADAYHDVRLAIGALRTGPPVHLSFGKALANSLETFTRRSGIDVRLISDCLEASFPKLVELQLHAILHQALSNVRKHSRASQVVVAFGESSEGWEMTIADNGHGFVENLAGESDSQTHFGLSIMKERAQSFGGSVSIFSCDGQGVTVKVVIPKAALTRPRCHIRLRHGPGGYRVRQVAHGR